LRQNREKEGRHSDGNPVCVARVAGFPEIPGTDFRGIHDYVTKLTIVNFPIFT